MAFGQAAVPSPASCKNAWARPSTGGSSVSRNSSARGVGAIVVGTRQPKLGLQGSVSQPFKVSHVESGSLSDVSTSGSMSDDSMTSSRCSTSEILSPTSLPGSLEDCFSASSSPEENPNQDGPRQTSTRTRGDLSQKRARSPDHFGRISFQLGRRAGYKSLVMCEAFCKADKDKDGILTVSDMEEVFRHFNLPSSDATIFFKLMDKGDHGRIWWREVVAVLRPMLNVGEPCGLFWDQFEDDDWP